MYAYEWDKETGGFILNTTQLVFSKEPRPVYYKELDILGFDKIWNYDKDDSLPYMWAEANNYIYRGRLVAKLKGGAVYSAPEVIEIEAPEQNGRKLRFVDIQAMIENPANQEIMDSLVNSTIKKIYNTYEEYKNRVDVFYVAFSGGKDSIAALDLVQRALPHNRFKVVFGDTGMEFPDTYAVVKKIEDFCLSEKIEFYRASSHLSPPDTWRLIGPPSQTMRWCCSIHKTTPQILLLRALLDKPNYKGMAFTGIRGDESVSRSEYSDVSLGEKHKGQYSSHPILEWNSAELFLYTYTNALLINEAYKKGNSRAGCLVCPMATSKNEFFKEVCYACGDATHNTTSYNRAILETTIKSFNTNDEARYYMNIGGWKARRSGRELKNQKAYCDVSFVNGTFKIELLRENTAWMEWIKTVGETDIQSGSQITILYRDKRYELRAYPTEDRTVFIASIGTNSNTDIHFMSALKTVFRKSAYCIGCRACEANCPNGFISFKDGNVQINSRCVSCGKCHEIAYGCLVANSQRLPKGEGKKMQSIDRYFNMGVELDWVRSYFKEKDEFWSDKSTENTLGSKKIVILKRFLSDAGITNDNQISAFGMKIDELGVDNVSAWALMLVNLSQTSQFQWYIKNIGINQTYTPDAIKTLIGDEMTENSKNNIVSAYKNIFISNEYLGKGLGLGHCDYDDKNGKRFLRTITRRYWENPDPLVILYSLFKFAEACGDYYQFTLSRLLNHGIDSDGISPTEIFGLDRETMERIVTGLSINYPDFIASSFTLDLDNITLRAAKNSQDVLELF